MRRYAFTSSWFRQCMSCPVVFILVYLLIVVFELPVAIADKDCANNKPIVIDVRSNNQPESIDSELVAVDGVIRYLHPVIDMQKLLLNGKHEIQPINLSESRLHNLNNSMKDNNGSNLQVDSLLSMIGREEDDGFGISVAGVNDFNGDGYHDFVIGAPFHWGDAYLYFGGKVLDSIPDIEIHGDYSLGWPVASAGDINCDGFGDFILGAALHGENRTGKVYIFFGSRYDAAYISIGGFEEKERFGADVASLGDINRDGYDDIIVGTADYNRSGKAYLFFGGSPMDTIPDFVFQEGEPGENFGYALASAGDLNGDDAPDIIIGNRWIVVDRVWIYYGGSLLDSIPDLIFSGPKHSDFGWEVGTAGDINNDGFDDVMVSAHWYTDVPGITPPGYGRLYIYHGGTTMDTVPDLIIKGTIPRGDFSIGLSTLGDINFDAYDDIAVGAFGPNSNEISKARVFLGGQTMGNADTLADVVIEGESIGDYFSNSLSGTHDLNGDGLNDLIIGANEHTTILWQDGKAYVYSILPGKRGDINGDGKINAIDVVMLINIIIGRSSPPVEYELWAADIIVDKAINIEDVLEMVNLILEFH